MTPKQHQHFVDLAEAGVFEELFQEVEENIQAAWKNANTTHDREELWSRQRALRDLRRAFNKPTQGVTT